MYAELARLQPATKWLYVADGTTAVPSIKLDCFRVSYRLGLQSPH